MDKSNKRQMTASELARTIREMSMNGDGSVQQINSVLPRRYLIPGYEFDEFVTRKPFDGDRPAGFPEQFQMDRDDSDYESAIDSLNDDISDELFQYDQMKVDKKDPPLD